MVSGARQQNQAWIISNNKRCSSLIAALFTSNGYNIHCQVSVIVLILYAETETQKVNATFWWGFITVDLELGVNNSWNILRRYIWVVDKIDNKV